MITERLKDKLNEIFAQIGITRVYYDTTDSVNISADNETIGVKTAKSEDGEEDENEFIKENCYVHISPYAEGRIEIRYGDMQETTVLPIYFCCALKEQDILDYGEKIRIFARTEIEKQIIKPFIQEYNKSKMFERITNIDIIPSISLFDDREACVMIRINCREFVC